MDSFHSRQHVPMIASGNHIRACKTNRPDNLTSPLELHSADDGDGEDETTVGENGGRNGS